MAGVDADAHGLVDHLGTSAPEPVVVGQVGIVGAALAVAPVAGGAVVAEELAARLRTICINASSARISSKLDVSMRAHPGGALGAGLRRDAASTILRWSMSKKPLV